MCLSFLTVCVLCSILSVCCWYVSREVEQAGLSDLEIISQPVEDENQCLAPPVQLVSFGYRDLPLAALDLSLAGSQLLSNADEDENREGWVKLVLIVSCGYCLLPFLNIICLCGSVWMAHIWSWSGVFWVSWNVWQQGSVSDTVMTFFRGACVCLCVGLFSSQTLICKKLKQADK